MSCPYALSLNLSSNGSGDNNSSENNATSTSTNAEDNNKSHGHDHGHPSPIPSSPQLLDMTPMQALQLAKSSCPAFQSSCPFRNVQDAHSMRKALENLPKSHLHVAAAADATANGNGNGNASGDANANDDGNSAELKRKEEVEKENQGSNENASANSGINQTLRVALQHVHDVSRSLRSSSDANVNAKNTDVNADATLLEKINPIAHQHQQQQQQQKNVDETEPFLPSLSNNNNNQTKNRENKTNNESILIQPVTKGRSRSNSFMESHRKFELAGGICPYKTLNPQYRNNSSDNASDNASASHATKSSDSNAVKFVHAMEELSFNAILAQLIDKQDATTSATADVATADVATADVAATTTTTTTTVPSPPAISSSSPPSPSPKTKSTLKKSRSNTSLSGSLSTALKVGTAASHSSAESVHFVKEFIKGNIQLPLYIKLLSNLYWVYRTLERQLDCNAPNTFPTLHKVELYRMESLQDDLEFFCTGLDFNDGNGDGNGNVDDDDNSDDADIERKIPPSQATKDYVHRIEYIAKEEPLLLLSHAYTRYLGDLSGGKVLARVAKRALNLGSKSSSVAVEDGTSTSTGVCDGLSFYHFAKIASAKKFKDEYRQALDDLDFLTVEQIERLVAEANVAFVLNMRIFEELDVLAGVKGAAVRDYSEATIYYEDCVQDQKRRMESGDDGSDNYHGALFGQEGMEGAECPFAKLGSANPHEKKGGETAESSVNHKDGGRCPWPFVFFHDPKTGMQDWQTWLVIGLVLCWVWSYFV